MRKFKGFTLIEIIIYLALFSIIIGGVLVSAYQIIQASTQSQENALVQEEVQFLMGKVRWAMTGAKTINSPSSGSPATTLDIVKFNNSNVIIDWFAPDLVIQPGNTKLNSESVSVSNAGFTYIDPFGAKPAAVQTVITVTSQLAGFSQTASSTIYLRK